MVIFYRRGCSLAPAKRPSLGPESFRHFSKASGGHRMTKDEDPKDNSSKEEERKRGLRRREFVKLVGGTGVAATAQVLAGHKLASAATTTVPEGVGSGAAGQV